jgi:hypothetical protein
VPEFNITAKLHLQGPTNLAGVVGNINRGLRGANATVDINTTAARSGIGKLNSGLEATQRVMRQVQA